jgi:hypothetical protein
MSKSDMRVHKTAIGEAILFRRAPSDIPSQLRDINSTPNETDPPLTASNRTLKLSVSNRSRIRKAGPVLSGAQEWALEDLILLVHRGVCSGPIGEAFPNIQMPYLHG